MGIPEPEKRAKSYPFELSGGMQQRALIGIALAGQPKILIADEPTTALDVTVQAEILALLGYLQDQYRMSILIISHDLEMVAELTDRVMVMYTGRILEEADTGDLLASPLHPYTQGLLAAIPRLGAGSDTPLQEIPGSVPDLLDVPSGCSFHPRCEMKEEECTSRVPDLLQINYKRRCACFRVAAN
jgi:oligopeptide/dipeptide ABC transporter ATP-binding protein